LLLVASAESLASWFTNEQARNLEQVDSLGDEGV